MEMREDGIIFAWMWKVKMVDVWDGKRWVTVVTGLILLCF